MNSSSGVHPLITIWNVCLASQGTEVLFLPLIAGSKEANGQICLLLRFTGQELKWYHLALWQWVIWPCPGTLRQQKALFQLCSLVCWGSTVPSTELQNHIKYDMTYSAKISFKLFGSFLSVINLIVLFFMTVLTKYSNTYRCLLLLWSNLYNFY